jgi:hypothetical protein
MRRVKRLPSPPMMIALLALFVALTGSAAAVTVDFARNAGKVDGKDAVGASATRNHAAGNLVATKGSGAGKGRFAPKFIPRDTRWAQVAANGTIVRQSGGISMESSGSGNYWLDFGSNQTHRAISVTPIWAGPDAEESATTVLCGGGTGAANCIVAGTNDNHHIYVQTWRTGTNQAQPFFIAVSS